MFHYLKQIVFAVAPYAVGPPLLLGIWLFRKLPAAGKLICIHLLFAAMVELMADLLWHYHTNNLFLLHIYTVEECGLILWFYSYLLGGIISRKFFGYVFLSFFAFALYSLILYPTTYSMCFLKLPSYLSKRCKGSSNNLWYC